MRRHEFGLIALAALLIAGPAVAAPAKAPPPPTQKVELTKMMGRWYEVARLPNLPQKGCQGASAEWTKTGETYSVLQVCHKGSPTGPQQTWKAMAKVLDPRTNARIQMSFFGGALKHEYWVMEHHPDAGWLIMATPGGKGLWLFSQRPTVSASVRAQALARIKQLGYDVAALEWPAQVRN